MNIPRVTFRKIVVAAGSGLAGVVVGGTIVRYAAPRFVRSPPWLLPAIVVGILAALVMAALIMPTIIDGHRRSKQKAAASR
jgi:nucleoside permease NupC